MWTTLQTAQTLFCNVVLAVVHIHAEHALEDHTCTQSYLAARPLYFSTPPEKQTSLMFDSHNYHCIIHGKVTVVQKRKRLQQRPRQHLLQGKPLLKSPRRGKFRWTQRSWRRFPRPSSRLSPSRPMTEGVIGTEVGALIGTKATQAETGKHSSPCVDILCIGHCPTWAVPSGTPAS